jgi:hypothetical protein
MRNRLRDPGITERAQLSDRARALIERLGPAKVLSPEAYARIRSKLDARESSGSKRRHVWIVALAVATLGIIGGATASTLGILPLRFFLDARAPSPPLRDGPRFGQGSGRREPIDPGAELDDQRPAHRQLDDIPSHAHVETNSEDRASAPPHSLRGRLTRVLAVRRSSAPSALALEAELLGHAVKAMESDGSPRQALAILDDYHRRHPHGALEQEANLIRIDALSAIGDQTRALGLLDSIDLSSTPRARELLVLRGELRGHKERCAEAIDDFTSALELDRQDAIDERAWFGRASCRALAGDTEGARKDLKRCLERHPRGKLAQPVRAALSGAFDNPADGSAVSRGDVNAANPGRM